MKLSVIMPVYNREEYVGAALRSLLRQRDAADLDIIVVDDGSTDGSADIVQALMGEASCIRLFKQANAGVTRARNSGLRQLLPRTEFVSFLDSDDISPAGRFKADLACFKADPGLDLTYSLMTLVDGMDDTKLEPAAGCQSVTVRGISLSAGIFRKNLLIELAPSTKSSSRLKTQTICCASSRAAPRFVMPDTIAIYYRRHPGNMTRELDVPLREFLRAAHKSMRRRKADPSLHRVEGIFDFKDLAGWRFM